MKWSSIKSPIVHDGWQADCQTSNLNYLDIDIKIISNVWILLCGCDLRSHALRRACTLCCACMRLLPGHPGLPAVLKHSLQGASQLRGFEAVRHLIKHAHQGGTGACAVSNPPDHAPQTQSAQRQDRCRSRSVTRPACKIVTKLLTSTPCSQTVSRICRSSASSPQWPPRSPRRPTCPTTCGCVHASSHQTASVRAPQAHAPLPQALPLRTAQRAHTPQRVI